MSSPEKQPTDLIDSALKLLGIRKFAVAVHDSSFPSLPEEDIGRGSPYSRGGAGFFQFARSLGFNAVQLGPQTKTPRDDPSPYNGAIFTKSVLSLAALSLADDPRMKGFIFATDLDRLLSHVSRQRSETRPDRIDHALAWEISHKIVDLVHARFRKLRSEKTEFVSAFDRYVADQKSAPVDWFERDGVFEALSQTSGIDDWQRWGRENNGALPLDQRLYCPHAGEEEPCNRRIQSILEEQKDAVECFSMGQFLLHLQHQRMRRETKRLGLRLYGDMHIGGSHQDWWAWRSLFLPGYLLGAPPSRTNREGQPWGYPVLHPHKTHTIGPRGEIVPGPVLRFVRARAEKMLAEFDGVRIDHPQGLVCPWVYRADDADPFHAVQHGARLYSSPDFADHPALRQFSLVRPAQLNPDPDCPRYADEHVAELSAEQIERYAVVLDTVIEAARSSGGNADDILCEVLSTWPMPLKAVMMQRGMGRFCITQKADPRNPDDVYRPENTAPGDWIMVGNHDTKPLRLLVEERKTTGWMRDRAGLLAERLAPESANRNEFAARIASDHRLFCEAMFADLFLGPAQNVSVFFADLLGEQRLYNQPGTIGGQNWTLRMPSDYQEIYARRVELGDALDIKRSLALALEAKAAVLGPDAAALAQKLRSYDASIPNCRILR